MNKDVCCTVITKEGSLYLQHWYLLSIQKLPRTEDIEHLPNPGLELVRKQDNGRE